MLECPPGGVARGVVAAEAVVEHRTRVGGEVDAQTACGRLPHGGLDQLRRLRLPAAPGRQHHLGIRNRRVPGRLGDQAIFFEQPGRCRQLAGDNVGRGKDVERELQVHQRTGLASEPDLASGHRMPGVEVPQLKGDDGAGPSASEPEPAAGFVGAGVQSQNQLKGPG